MLKNRVVVIAFTAILAAGVWFASTVEPRSSVKLTYYTVKAGDTVWDIAETFRNPDEDVRLRVDAIMKANEIGADANLTPGQKLLIPTDGGTIR